MKSKFIDMTTKELLEVKSDNYCPKEWCYTTYKTIVSVEGIKKLSDKQLSTFFNEIMSQLSASKDNAEVYQDAEDFYNVARTEIYTRYRLSNVV